MITVNPIFIEEFLTPMVGGGDREEDKNVIRMSNCNLDHEGDSVVLIREFLLPSFNSLPDPIKIISKYTLAYYLYFNKIDFEDILSSIMAPVKYSKNVRPFFVKIWKEIFKEESYEYIKDLNVKEEFDIEAPLKLYKKIKQ